jgi:hypothetical protein
MWQRWFYEIRATDTTLLKRDGRFATLDAALEAGHETAKKMKHALESVGVLTVGREPLPKVRRNVFWGGKETAFWQAKKNKSDNIYSKQ